MSGKSENANMEVLPMRVRTKRHPWNLEKLASPVASS